MENKKINILFIHPYKHSIGPNVVLLNLIKWLDREKFNLFVIFPSRPPFVETIEKLDIQVFVLPNLLIVPRTYNPIILLNYFLGQIKIILILRKIIDINKIDVVHISTPAYWLISIISKFCKVKCTFHAQDLTSMNPKFVGQVTAFFLNLFADKIICVSNAVLEAWRSVGVSVNKLITIYNGIDLNHFKPLPESEYSYLKEELKLQNRYPIIGMIAGMDPRKGHRYFIEAAVQIKKVFPKSAFLVVGSLNFPEYYQYFENLKQLVKRFNLENSLFFLNERKDIPQIINLCDLMIVPSETEAGPLAVLEIQACGKTLVASRIGGIPEYLVDQKTGLLVPSRDSEKLAETAINLLQNHSQLKSMGLIAREFVQKFKIQEKIKEIENLYFQLLNRG